MKGFLRKVLLIASIGATLAFYGCTKDFTQDIEDVRKDLIAALEQQNAALTASINQAKQDAQKYADEAAQAAKDYADKVADAAAKKAEAAQAAADAAQATADDAKSKAEAAQTAANEAKKAAEDALTAAKEYADKVAAEKALEAYNKAMADVKPLLEQTLTDAKSYTNEQIKALKSELEKKITDLETEIQGAIDGLKATVDALDGRVEGLEDSVEALTAKVDAVKTELMTYIDGEVNKLKAADKALDVRLTALEAFQAEMKSWQETVNADLENLKKGIEDLQGQLSTLADELKKADAKLAEDIAKVAADLKSFQESMAAEIQGLKDMISELQGICDELKSLILENKAKIAALEAEVKSNYDELKADVAAINETLAEHEAALEAAKQYLEGKIDDLGEALRAEMAEADKALQDQIDILDKSLEDLKTEFNGKIDEVYSEIDKRAKELEDKINTEVERLDGRINDVLSALGRLEDAVKNRITSISLIPEMYVQGIESINVPVISYNAITVEKDETFTSSLNTNVLPWYATTPIRYHVSPSNVTTDCISAAEYLTENATIVKSLGSSVLNVAFDAIKINENNELVIPVSRVAAASKVFTVENFMEVSHANWPTVALSLGIAEKYLVDETSANVISEYSAYTETPYNIHITPAENSCTALECTYYYRTYADAINVENVANISRLYTETVNLRELVLSHIYSDKIVEEEDLKAMGLDYRFAIPTEPQEVGDNKTDQQKFIQFADESNELVKSTVPGGYADNEAAIGRTPVVRVELYDVNNGNIVDVQWIKIKWVKAQIPPQSFDNIKSFDSILDCSTFYEYKLDWATLNEKVLGAFKDENGEVTGISNKEFVDYYSNATLSIDYENSDFERFVSVSQNKDAFTSTEPTTNVYTVKVDYRGLAGILPEIIENGKATRKVTVKITPRTDKDFYVGVLSFSVTLNWTVVDLPTVRYNNVGNWTIKNTLAQIDPVGYDDAENFSGSSRKDTKVRYNFEMLAGNGLFNPDASQNNRFITNLTTENEELDFSCRSWDMQFSPDRKGYGDYMQTVKPGFGFAYNFTKNTSDAGYRVGVSSIYMAKMVYRNRPTEFVNWYDPTDLPEDKITTIRFRLPDPKTYRDGDIQRARNLLNDLDTKPEDRVRIPVNVLVNITPDFTNVYTAATYDVWVVSPVKIDSLSLSGKEFEDWNKDKNTITFNGQPFGTDVKIKDFQGVVITSEQFGYYGIEQPTWNLSASQILTNVTVDADGNRVVDNSLNPNKGDVAKMWSASKAGFKVSSNTDTPSKYTLTVTNATGTQLTEDVTLWIKVTYKHAFRDYAYYIPVKYKKNENKPIDPIE